jgi:hypothetical protein
MRIARRVARGEVEELPPWDDWSGLVEGGGRFILFFIVWFLPLLGLACVAAPFVTFGLVGSTVNREPSSALGVLVLLGVAWALVSAIYSIFVAFVSPAGLGRAAVYESASAGLSFGEVLRLVRTNAALFFAVFLAREGVFRLASVLEALWVVGSLLSIAMIAILSGHLTGQAMRLSHGLHDPVPLPDPAAPPLTAAPGGIEPAIHELFAPGWEGRLLGAAALALIPVFGWVVLLGRGAQYARVSAARYSVPRPGWDNLGKLVSDGLQMLVALVVLTIPAWLTLALFTGPQYARMLQQFRNFGDFDRVPTIPALTAFSLPALGLATLLQVVNVMAICLMPAVLGRIAMHGSLLAGFNLAAIYGMIRAQPFRYAGIAILQLGCVMLIPNGFAFFGVGVFIGIGIAVLLSGYLYGELFRDESQAVALI